MKKACRSFVKIGGALSLVLGLVVSQNQSAFAGWTGLISVNGTGWASVNVRSSTGISNRVTTVNNLALPSASMAPTNGYKTNAPLPAGALATTFSRIKALPNGGWLASANGTNSGDGTDNAELQQRLTIVPSDCASLTFDSVINQSPAEFAANGNSGTITVNAKATAGTALWLRGFEYTGSMADVPLDNPDTVENEAIEYLKAHGSSKFETLIAGPFEFGGPGGSTCPLIIPFSLSSTNLEHLVYATDGVTLSLPLVVFSPSNVVVKCDEPFSYPPVQFLGCGTITVSYVPAPLAGGVFPAGHFPVGVTPVTATATDVNGNSVSSSFTVTVTDTIPPVRPTLTNLTFGMCGAPATPPTPTTTDNCKGVVSGTTTTPFPITTPGTTAVIWTFNDGNGNSTTATQNVTVAGLTFKGFYSPIGTVSNLCSAPVVINQGSVAPFKFDVFCGASPVTTGQPPIVKIQVWNGCVQGAEPVSVNAVYQNDWHYNWDTTGWAKGIYKIIVVMPDQSTRHVFVKLK
jgi:hypothetical protein